MIDRHRSYEDTSYIVISELLNLCGYKQTRHKPKIFFEIAIHKDKLHCRMRFGL